jgi:hypothetical protein
VADVAVEVGGAEMHLGEGRDADTEVPGLPDQADQFGRVPDTLRMCVPGTERVAGRVSAQSENIAHALIGVVAENVAQFGDAVVHRDEVGDRGEGGLLGEPLGGVDGPASRRAAGTVGH